MITLSNFKDINNKVDKLTRFINSIVIQVRGTISNETILTVASKTTYYVNAIPFVARQRNI